MKKITLFICVLLSLFFTVFSSYKASATHAAGGEIIYEWVSDSTYRFYFKFYRDCSGTASEPSTVSLCYDNTCNGQTGSVVLSKIVTLPDGTANGSPVSLGCPGFPTKCTSTSSSIPGYREWWYSNLVTLPSRCDHWRFFTGINARNNAITNLQTPGSQTLWVEATFDNLNAQGNSSPNFTIKPVPYCCVGYPFTYNNGGVDPNNDSLVFSAIQPRTGGTTCGTNPNPTNIQYSNIALFNVTNNPFDCNNTFTVNSVTGQLNFTPASQQIVVVTILCEEYRNGHKIGSVLRDIQIIIEPCNPPSLALNYLTPFTNAQYNNNRVEGCAGQTMTFCWNIMAYTDLAHTIKDVGSVLVSTDNHAAVLPGSFTSNSNILSDSLVTCLTWTPGINDTGTYYVTVLTRDSSCRPPGIPVPATFTIPIYIWPHTYASGDTTVCPNTQVPLHAWGGGNFVWSVYADTGSTATTASLSCTNCTNPIVTAVPGKTMYIVTSDVAPFCNQNIDTVIIRSIPVPSFSLSPRNDTTCGGKSLTLDVGLNPPSDTSFHYIYQWSPATALSSTTVEHPVTSTTSNITYTLTVTPTVGTSVLTGCAATATENTAVLQDFDFVTKDDTLCWPLSGVGILPFTPTPTTTPDPAYSFAWTPTTGVSNTTIPTPAITPVAPVNWGQDEVYTLAVQYPKIGSPLCASVKQITFHIMPQPSVTLGPDRTICYTDTIHVYTDDSPTNAYQYQWTKLDGTVPTQLDFPFVKYPIFTGRDTDTLILRVYNVWPAGCENFDTITYNVIPPNFLDLSGERSLCPNDTVQLTTSGSNLVSVTWTPDLYISDAHSQSPYVWPVVTTSYTVLGINNIGCKDTAMVKVNVYPAGVISLPDSVRLFPGESYHLNPAGNCLYYTWFPQLYLSQDNTSDPIVTPGATMTYYVTGLTEHNCKSNDSITVFLNNDSYISVPNVFVPGNGENGKFNILHSGIASLKTFTVFNRWGNKVFETNDINEGWDGKFNGEPQPLGVYIYLIEGYTAAGVKVSKQGNITLLR